MHGITIRGLLACMHLTTASCMCLFPRSALLFTRSCRPTEEWSSESGLSVEGSPPNSTSAW